MVKIRAYLCHLWENKNTIRMANSCHNHSQLCCVKGKSGEGSDAPPTLERSGSERRVGAFNIPCPMRGEGLGESGGASLQGKGGRVGFRKVSLMLKRDGVILERLYLLSYSMYFLPYSKPSSEQRFAQCLGRIMLHEA